VAGLQLRLPEPCLVVLVGAAGSGKSTLAERLFSADQVLSSDAFRAVVSGDAADQRTTRAAFAILHRELDRRLAGRHTTVVDATNVTAFARRSLLRIAARHRLPAVAIVVDLDPTLVQARNAARGTRIVPAEAVERQLEALSTTLRRDGLATAGFAAIIHLRTTAEVDSLEIVRRPSLT